MKNFNNKSSKFFGVLALALPLVLPSSIFAQPYEHYGGLSGYMVATGTSSMRGSAYGMSFYTGVWQTFSNDQPSGYQMGHGTWITPDNGNYNRPLCPKGTMARDNWPERGPSYRDVFQTIEGGPGYWGNTAFPSNQMKYRINGTTDCYTTQTSSPGWHWGGGQDPNPGLVALSNRLVYPPDGITFEQVEGNPVLGNAWMALPLSPRGHAWTLYLNAENFSGPVAYWSPESWQRITKGDRYADGRGLDAKLPGISQLVMANEIGSIGYFSEELNGKQYAKIPKLDFPVDETLSTTFQQQWTVYNKEAIYGPLEQAINGGLSAKSSDGLPEGVFSKNGSFPVQLNVKPLALQHKGRKTDLSNYVSTRIFSNPLTGERGYGWGLKWKDSETAGTLPQYLRASSRGGNNLPLKEDQLPAGSTLPAAAFAKAPHQIIPYVSRGEDHLYMKGWGQPASPILQLALNDGSTLIYGWYKFIDQPQIQKLGLSNKERKKLQDLVEAIHLEWSLDKEYMAPPDAGFLVSVDSNLLVKPPKGFEIGYVPITLCQVKTGHAPTFCKIRKTFELRADLIAGTFVRQPVENKWHEGTISIAGDNYLWTNKAGVSWGLRLRPGRFITDDRNPYYNEHRTFTIEVGENGELAGFTFGTDSYTRVER